MAYTLKLYRVSIEYVSNAGATATAEAMTQYSHIYNARICVNDMRHPWQNEHVTAYVLAYNKTDAIANALGTAVGIITLSQTFCVLRTHDAIEPAVTVRVCGHCDAPLDQYGICPNTCLSCDGHGCSGHDDNGETQFTTENARLCGHCNAGLDQYGVCPNAYTDLFSGEHTR